MSDQAERICGSCSLCCKIMRIEELEKPADSWCRHCTVGKGCRIYSERPAECRRFTCGYLSWEGMPDYWFPARSKMVVTNDGTRIAVHVDPSRPESWRAEPYYSEIKSWSTHAMAEGQIVGVCIKNRVIVIFPDRDVDLGRLAPNERVQIRESVDFTGTRLDAVKVTVDDASAAGIFAKP